MFFCNIIGEITLPIIDDLIVFKQFTSFAAVCYGATSNLYLDIDNA